MPWGEKNHSTYEKKKNANGNNIKYTIDAFVLKPTKKSERTYFKPSTCALKYCKNQQKSTKMHFLKTSYDHR